jgi:hypothetical protein
MLFLCFSGKTTAHTLTATEAKKIGQKIWINEGAGKVEKLTWWNEGEQFASLGIGHFIWYPKCFKGQFKDTFPQLVKFLAHHKKLPACLRNNKTMTCPWNTREEFFAAFNSKDMKALRQFLAETIDLQTKFIVARLEYALPSMLAKLDVKNRAHVKKQFYRVAKNSTGLYALIDYVNFKGEGIKEQENYNGTGWGLLQVLQAMQGDAHGEAALAEFSTIAFNLLTKRVQNSPPQKNEARWLPGWKNRLDTYKILN